MDTLAMDLIKQVEHCPDASKEFIGDVCRTGHPFPNVRVPANQPGNKTMGGHPSLIVIRICPVLQTHSNASQTVHQMVAADGSNSLCECVFNSGTFLAR